MQQEFIQKVSTYLSFTLTKLQEILYGVKKAFQITNPDYNTLVKRLHLYYDMKLATFGTENEMNLII